LQLLRHAEERTLRSRRRAAIRALVAASTFHHAPNQLQSLGLCSIIVAATARLRHIPVCTLCWDFTGTCSAPSLQPCYAVAVM